MRAVVCHQGTLSVEDVPAPAAGPGQLLLDVARCGICGSDLHARHHADELSDVVAEVGYTTAMRPGHRVVLGHEIVGRVASYGPDTRRRWKPGALVVALPVVRTGGEVHLVGFDTAAPGGLAEQTVVQEAFTFPVPDGTPVDRAAFTEPLAVAWHAVRRGAVGRNQPAIVVGCGPIGLAVILMLKASGVRQVIASDLSAGRRALARACGADVVVDPRERQPFAAYDQKGPVRTLPDYLGFGIDTMSRLRRVPLLPWERLMRVADTLGATPSGPVVFECVGVPGMIEQIAGAAPLHTRVVVVGVCMEADRFRPAMGIHKELDLRFVFGYDPAEFAHVLGLIAAGKVDPSPLHTGTVGLDGVAGAFDALGDPEKHAKILVDPGSAATL
ncbi:zinc-binding dehydrogenase [Nocardioides sp. DS6]|uniref:Zinc-binding dehydrogenase n=1 Tax=Nocardioides eburneus TaxID=3231482 RepID=A0ABV3SWV0_9ACTN